jgi:hypothetical protein
MVPASVTITSTIAAATGVVTEFSGLILLVAGLAVGIWGVRFLIGQIRSAR